MNIASLLSVKVLAITAATVAVVAGTGLVVYVKVLSPTADTITGGLSILHGDYFGTGVSTYEYGVIDAKGKTTPIVFQDKDHNILASGPEPDALNITPNASGKSALIATVKGKRRGKTLVLPAESKETADTKYIKTATKAVIRDSIQTGQAGKAILTGNSANGPGTNQVAIIQVSFTDTKSYDSLSPSQLVAITSSDPNSPNAYYREESNNVTGFNATYAGGVQLPMATPGGCAALTDTNTVSAIAQDSRNMIAGFNDASYQSVIINLPPLPGCDGGTAAASEFTESTANNGTDRTVLAGGANYNARNLAHELGHTLGLYHADKASCGSSGSAWDDNSPNTLTFSGNVAINDSCQATGFDQPNFEQHYEYGDPDDIMSFSAFAPYVTTSSSSTSPGYEYPHLNAIHDLYLAATLGWALPPTAHVTSNGTYVLAPMAANCSQVKILDIVRPSWAPGSIIQRDIFVEYRQAVPGKLADSYIDPSDDNAQGVEIRVASTEGSSNTSQLGGDSELIGILMPGKTLTDTTSGVRITMNGTSSQGASVSVTFP